MSIGFIIGLINKDQGSMSAEIVPLQQIRANLTGLLRRINPFWSIIGTAFISVCLFVFSLYLSFFFVLLPIWMIIGLRLFYVTTTTGELNKTQTELIFLSV